MKFSKLNFNLVLYVIIKLVLFSKGINKFNFIRIKFKTFVFKFYSENINQFSSKNKHFDFLS